MAFSDISKIENTNDYLPLVNGCLNAELCIIFLCVYEFFVSSQLREWYKQFQLTALFFDITTLLLIIILTRFLYKYLFKDFKVIYFIILAVILQILYNALFYVLVNNYWLKNDIFLFQKKYIQEIGFKSFMFYSIFIMILACLLSSYYCTVSVNSNIINLIASIYFYSFMINEV